MNGHLSGKFLAPPFAHGVASMTEDRVGAKQRISTWFRTRRDRVLRDLIVDLFRESGRVEILDLGGNSSYWKRVGEDFLRSNNCRITILNLYESELHLNLNLDICKFVVGDATNLESISDHQFDLVHSNSVIEHLFTWEAMKRFAHETVRTGRHYYLQTPNFWFPVDPHFPKVPMFHWLPRPTRAWLLKNFTIAHAGRLPSWDSAYQAVDGSRLLSARQLAVLFPQARLDNEKLLGLIKSFVLIA